MPLDFESLDLLTVADILRANFVGSTPDGYLEGKTACRDVLVRALKCSELEAEQLVDTLLVRGYLTFRASELDAAHGTWAIADGA